MNTLPLIELRAITRRFKQIDGELEALHPLSLTIDSGEQVAITGHSGSGKSTLLHLLGLLDTVSSGELIFAGQATSKLSADARARLRNSHIGFVYQAFHLIPWMNALENVELPLTYASHPAHHGSRPGAGASGTISTDNSGNHPGSSGLSSASAHVHSSLSSHGQPRGPRSAPAMREAALEALRAVGLPHRANARANTLSGGEKQRVAIARAIVTRPRLLLADEPTGALDEATSASVMTLLRSITRETGAALVMVTHDMRIAATLERRLIMKQGHLQAPESLS